jgi:hypothetical protein
MTSNLNFLLFKCIVFIITLISVKANIWRNGKNANLFFIQNNLGNIDRQSIGYGSNSQTFRHILKNLPAGANSTFNIIYRFIIIILIVFYSFSATLIPLGQVLIPSGKEYLLCTKNGQPCNPNGANVFSGSMSSGYGSNMAGNGYGNNCCQSFNGNPYGQFGGNPYGNFMGNIGNSYMNNGGQSSIFLYLFLQFEYFR